MGGAAGADVLIFVAVRLPACGWSLYGVCLGREAARAVARDIVTRCPGARVARGAVWWGAGEVWA